MLRQLSFGILCILASLLVLLNYHITRQINNTENTIKQNYIKNWQIENRIKDESDVKIEPKSQILKFYETLNKSEAKNFSQNGEDGVIQEILKLTNRNYGGNYVEIGAGDGFESNTRNLRINFDWSGVAFDYNNKNLKLNVKMKKITHMNILQIFQEQRIDREIDLLSIDTDFSDYWILEKILEFYKPKYVIHEINQQPPDQCVTVAKLNGLAFWDNHSKYFGASLCAYYCLAIRFEYTMVYCESKGVNCFWIRNDILENKFKNIDAETIQKELNPNLLYRKVKEEYKEFSRRTWIELNKCF
ncbi:unnamed protein product [Brachionus calyciflorus]|uniref:Methyltransferase FkbM domain-containing protein n=1 Tax=Brachionus calyciflorus TaxID=104777 RepID=A0A813WAP7_9BILA|nr:unnamed protein product [Brachionus calyciflorus]